MDGLVRSAEMIIPKFLRNELLDLISFRNKLMRRYRQCKLRF